MQQSARRGDRLSPPRPSDGRRRRRRRRRRTGRTNDPAVFRKWQFYTAAAAGPRFLGGAKCSRWTVLNTSYTLCLLDENEKTLSFFPKFKNRASPRVVKDCRHRLCYCPLPRPRWGKEKKVSFFYPLLHFSQTDRVGKREGKAIKREEGERR